jgi:hypothetical protein
MSRRNIAIVSALFVVATLQMWSLALTLKLTFEGLRGRNGQEGAENCVARHLMIGIVGKAWYSMCGEQRNTQILVGKPEEKRQHGSPRRRWETILIRILKKYDEMWTELICLGIGTSGRLL